jgi:hypothetical protein
MKGQSRIDAVSVIAEHLVAAITLVCGADPHSFILCRAVIQPLTTVGLMKRSSSVHKCPKDGNSSLRRSAAPATQYPAFEHYLNYIPVPCSLCSFCN